MEEIKAFWGALDNENTDAAGALRLLLLTGQRQANVLGMRWADVDFGECLWSIPASDTKTGDAYEVPLSGPAIWILSGLRGRDHTWVFPMRDKDAPQVRDIMQGRGAPAQRGGAERSAGSREAGRGAPAQRGGAERSADSRKAGR